MDVVVIVAAMTAVVGLVRLALVLLFLWAAFKRGGSRALNEAAAAVRVARWGFLGGRPAGRLPPVDAADETRPGT